MTGSARRNLGMVIGILLIVIAMLCAGAVATAELSSKWRDLEARQAELSALQRRLAGHQEPNRAGFSANDPFLDGSTFSLAANALQQRLVGLIEANGGTLVMASIDPPAADAASNHRAVAQAVAEMTIEGLQQVLYLLESEAPLVFVNALTIERRAAQSGEATTGERPALRVDLRVAGYYHAGMR